MNQYIGSNRERLGKYPLHDIKLPYVPIKYPTALDNASSAGYYGRHTNQNPSLRRKIGQVIILPDNENSPMYGEIPLYYEGDNPDLFLGKVVKRISRSIPKPIAKITRDVGRFANKASRTIGKTIDTVKRVTGPLGSVVDFAWRMSPTGQVLTWGRRGFNAASDIAQGKRIDRVFRKLARSGIDDIKERLRYAEMIAAFVPGLGTGVAAALGAANALASGKPITEAMISAARSAIPGGKVAQIGFDMAVNVARGKNLSQAALNSVRTQLPGGPGAQAAFDAGLALAQGKKLQQAAFAAAGRIIPPSPFAADALSFVRTVASGKNIQHAALSAAGRRIIQGKTLNKQIMHPRRELGYEFNLN